MLGNQYYHRSFIILKSKDKGYGLKENKEPAGYCKIEIRKNKGRMQLYIQDIKSAEESNGIYDVVLISNSKEIKPIKLTSIQIESNGKGEYAINFDPVNVQETGLALDNFHAIAIVFRTLSGDLNIHYPLVGYANKRLEIDWNGTVIQSLSQIYCEMPQNQTSSSAAIEETSEVIETGEIEEAETAEVNEHPEEVKSVEVGEPIKEEELVEKVEPIEEDELTEETELADDTIKTQSLEPDEVGADTYTQSFEWPNMEIDDLGNFPFKEEDIALNEKGSETSGEKRQIYWDRVKDYFTRLFDNHKKVCPFDDTMGEVDWIRVEHVCEEPYPYYPGPAYGYQTTGPYLDHYLVGLVRKSGRVGYVVYGIPGLYSSVPPMSMHGFSRWLPVKNGYGSGYWLLYVDAETGNIAYPY